MVTEWLEMLAGAVALAGLLFGLIQYWKAEKWKRAEFAAGQLQRLSSEASLAACCRALDWRSRTIPVPEHLRIKPDEYTFQHNWTDLVEGLKPETERRSFERVHELYRDMFDEFFTYLEQVNHFIEIQLISTKQISALKYWLEQIAIPRFASGAVFEGFISHYGYTGVARLMTRFGIHFRRAI